MSLIKNVDKEQVGKLKALLARLPVNVLKELNRYIAGLVLVADRKSTKALVKDKQLNGEKDGNDEENGTR